MPVSLDAALDWRVFAFTLALCSAAALLAGLAPAWHASRANLNDSLKAAAPDPRRARLRTLLTVAQVAIGTLVLAVSGAARHHPAPPRHRARRLRSRSRRHLHHGHRISRAIRATRIAPLALRLEREARAIPGVASAAIGSRSLMRGSGMKTAVALPGQRGPHDLNASTNAVSPAWFETMGMSIVAGRNLVEADGARRHAHPRRGQPELRAPLLSRSEIPLGRQFGIGRDQIVKASFEIVGVVSDARYRSFREPFQPTIFSCFCGARAGDCVLPVGSARRRARPKR